MPDRWYEVDQARKVQLVEAGLDLLRRGVSRAKLVGRLLRQFGSSAVQTMQAAARRAIEARDAENAAAQRAGVARYQAQRQAERERQDRLVQLPPGYEPVYQTRRGEGYLSSEDIRVDVRYRLPGDIEDRRYAVFIPELTGLSSNAARARIAYAIASHLLGTSTPGSDEVGPIYDALLTGDWDVYTGTE